MLEFVDSDLYFVQDKNNFKNPLSQVGSGSVEKIVSDPAGQKSTDPDPQTILAAKKINPPGFFGLMGLKKDLSLIFVPIFPGFFFYFWGIFYIHFFSLFCQYKQR